MKVIHLAVKSIRLQQECLSTQQSMRQMLSLQPIVLKMQLYALCLSRAECVVFSFVGAIYINLNPIVGNSNILPLIVVYLSLHPHKTLHEDSNRTDCGNNDIIDNVFGNNNHSKAQHLFHYNKVLLLNYPLPPTYPLGINTSRYKY